MTKDQGKTQGINGNDKELIYGVVEEEITAYDAESFVHQNSMLQPLLIK